MKKRILSCLFIALILFLSGLFPASAFEYIQFDASYDVCDFVAVSDAAYALCYADRHASITPVTAGSRDLALDLAYPIAAASVFGHTAVFLCEDSSNSQSVAYVYDIDRDYLDSFAINDVGLRYRLGFVYDHDDLYVVSSQDSRLLCVYSYGELVYTWSFDADITCVLSGYRGSCYAVSGGRLYRVSRDVCMLISGSDIGYPAAFIGEDMLMDADGRIFDIDGDMLDCAFTVDSDHYAASASLYRDLVYYPCGSDVYGYSIGSGTKRCYAHFDTPISDCFAYGDCLYCFCDQISPPQVLILPLQEMTAIISTSVSDDAISEQERMTPASSEHSMSSVQPDLSLSSDYFSESAQQEIRSDAVSENSLSSDVISSSVYTVDYDRYMILHIPSGTTFAQLKSNLIYDGFDVALYRDGRQRKSGRVGTAMTVVFTKDQQSVTFELSVDGDLTGEGNVNSRDVYFLMDYFLDDAWFNGVYTYAADLDESDEVDIRDLAILKRMEYYYKCALPFDRTQYLVK